MTEVSAVSQATATFLDLFRLKPVRPDLGLLGELSLSFGNLPWENLTKYLRKHLPAAPGAAAVPPQLRGVPGAERLRLSEEVIADHAAHGSGGTCFSLTSALRRIAEDLGFHVRPVMADMRHGPNVHCGLLVELEGMRYLLDPGYLVAEPVPLRPGQSVRVRLPGHRLEYRAVKDEDEFELHTVTERGEEQYRYRLRPRPVSDVEFHRFWLESFDATGMNGLHLNRVTAEGRLSAHNLNLRVDSGQDKTNIKLRDGYVEQVSERFRIDSELVGRAFAEWERQRCLRG